MMYNGASPTNIVRGTNQESTSVKLTRRYLLTSVRLDSGSGAPETKQANVRTEAYHKLQAHTGLA